MLMRSDAPTCKECGSIMFPKDGKHACVNCGTVADSPPPVPPPFEPKHKYDIPPLPKTVVRETVAPVTNEADVGLCWDCEESALPRDISCAAHGGRVFKLATDDEIRAAFPLPMACGHTKYQHEQGWGGQSCAVMVAPGATTATYAMRMPVAAPPELFLARAIREMWVKEAWRAYRRMKQGQNFRPRYPWDPR